MSVRFGNFGVNYFSYGATDETATSPTAPPQADDSNNTSMDETEPLTDDNDSDDANGSGSIGTSDRIIMTDDSIHNLRHVNATNVVIGASSTASFISKGGVGAASISIPGEPDLEVFHGMVPTQIKDIFELVIDPNIEDSGGKLYYKSNCFYNINVEPEYAITIPPDIYQRILSEVGDATQTPCGLYFCCHGGDGAHTGVSHDDYVDITLAWFLVGIVFGTMMYLSL